MKHFWHKIIVWYLRRCWGSFHTFSYGLEGRYVVLLDEYTYGQLKALTDWRGEK